MAIIVTTKIIDSDQTGMPNEFRVRLLHSADFPTGDTDPITGNPIVEHHAIESTTVFVATTAAQFRNGCKADGNAWKITVVSEIAGRTPKVIGAIRVGDELTY